MLRAREEPGAGAAARRGAGEGGAVGAGGIFDEALNSELTARLNAVVEGLTRCAHELREVTGTADRAAISADETFPSEYKEEVVLRGVSTEVSGCLNGRGGAGGGGGGDDDTVNDDSDDPEVAAVAMSVAAAVARRRPIPRSACARSTCAGDDCRSQTGGLAAPRTTPEPWAAPRRRVGAGPGSSASSCSSYVFRAGVEAGDWRERVPATPPPGRARAYPSKPERSPFELPTALNQREAPRSLVEWYMTRVYDPVQVMERAQRLAERREKEQEQNLPASLPNSPTFMGAADDSASDCPTDASGDTVVAAEEYASSRSVAAASSVDAASRASTPWCSSATPTPSKASAAYCYLPPGPDVSLPAGLPCVEVPPGSAWRPADEYVQPQLQAHPPTSSQHQVQTDLQRNRAHVMGSSLQLGGREDHPVHGNSPSHVSAPPDDRPSRNRPNTAGETAPSPPETLGEASDAIARERRRIRRKVLGGGVRPDWFNYDDAPEETHGPAAPTPQSSSPSPPPQGVVMAPTGPFPIAPQWVNADGQPIGFMQPQPFIQHPGMVVPGFPPQNMYYIMPKQDGGAGAPMECGMFFNYPHNPMIQMMPSPSPAQMLGSQGDAVSSAYLVQNRPMDQVPSDPNPSGDAPSSKPTEKEPEVLEKEQKEAQPVALAVDATDTDAADADGDVDTDADAAAPKRKPAKKRRAKSKQQDEGLSARAAREAGGEGEDALDRAPTTPTTPTTPSSRQGSRLGRAASSSALRHVSTAPGATAAAASRSRFNDALAGGTVRRMTQRARDLGLGATAAAVTAATAVVAARDAREALDAPRTPVLDARQMPRRSVSSSQHATTAQRLAASCTTETPLPADDASDGDLQASARALNPAAGASSRQKLALTDELLLSRPSTATKLKKAATSMVLTKGEPAAKPRPPKRENTFSLPSAHSASHP